VHLLFRFVFCSLVRFVSVHLFYFILFLFSQKERRQRKHILITVHWCKLVLCVFISWLSQVFCLFSFPCQLHFSVSISVTFLCLNFCLFLLVPSTPCILSNSTPYSDPQQTAIIYHPSSSTSSALQLALLKQITTPKQTH